MYLKDGREIIESDKYPGYFIDQSNGAWCDSEGNYVGGIADDGDAPGHLQTRIIDVPDIVFISKTGKQYYPKPNKTATTPIMLDEAHKRGYTPSAGYQKFAERIYKKALKQSEKSVKKAAKKRK